VKRGGEVPDQDSEVDSGLCAEVEQDPVAIQGRLGLEHLHGQAVMTDPFAGKGQGLGSPEATAEVLLEVLLAGPALHLREVLCGLRPRGLDDQDDLAQFLAQRGWDDHPVARLQVQVARVEVVEAARSAERDSDLGRHDGLSWTIREPWDFSAPSKGPGRSRRRPRPASARSGPRSSS